MLEILKASGILALGAAAGFALSAILGALLNRASLRHKTNWLDPYLECCKTPARLLLPLLGARLVLPLAVENWLLGSLGQALYILLIVAFAFFLLRALRATYEIISSQLGVDQSDNLEARRIQTQLLVIRGIAAAIVWFGAAMMVLSTFPDMRQLGTALLASAGVAGIIIGFSAQRVIANLLAGFQIAFTQPIRIDDVVVVENEWGRIEEITLTYVVVRIWDQRRLVLPISYFLEKPFTNWTRQTAEILGTVFLYVDYTTPVDEVRAQLERIAKASPHWDGRVCSLQVTDATEQTVQLRALVSAKDSGTAWDLRCEVREKLIAYLRDEFPDKLPRLRAELSQ